MSAPEYEFVEAVPKMAKRGPKAAKWQTYLENLPVGKLALLSFDDQNAAHIAATSIGYARRRLAVDARITRRGTNVYVERLS